MVARLTTVAQTLETPRELRLSSKAMIYRLRHAIAPNGVVTLRPARGWRLFFGFVAAGILGTIVHLRDVRGLLPFIGLLSIAAALYDERWRFDAGADEVRSRTGLIPFARSRRYRLSALRRIILRARAPYAGTQTAPTALARIQRGYVQLILEFVEEREDDEPSDIERPVVRTESLRARKQLRMLAKELSESLRVPLDESPG